MITEVVARRVGLEHNKYESLARRIIGKASRDTVLADEDYCVIWSTIRNHQKTQGETKLIMGLAQFTSKIFAVDDGIKMAKHGFIGHLYGDGDNEHAIYFFGSTNECVSSLASILEQTNPRKIDILEEIFR